MRTKELGAYYEAIVEHDITGETAPRLSEEDLKVRKNKNTDAFLLAEAPPF